MHPDAWNAEVQHFLAEDGRTSPFDYPELEYVRNVRRSKQLNNIGKSAIIISANGMAENGRILHHLKNNIEDNHNTVLLVSFMAENTLGRRLKDGEKRVHIFGESYDVRARVESIDGYSAHADQRELLEWAATLEHGEVQHLFVVHSEPEPADTFVRLLHEQGFANVTAPERTKFFDF
jgi:metallo-beta-lactamase family protein